MNNIIVTLVINFLLKHLEIFVGTVDWEALKAKFDASVHSAIHVNFLANAVCSVGNAVIDRFAAVLADEADLKNIAQEIAAGNYAAAFADLQMLLLAGWLPSGTDANEVVARAAVMAATTA